MSALMTGGTPTPFAVSREPIPAGLASLVEWLPGPALPASWSPGRSRLTTSGLPIEVSTSDRRGGADALRVVVDPGAGLSTFEERLAASWDACHHAAAVLPVAGADATRALLVAVRAALWPNASEVEPAVPWALWLGRVMGKPGADLLKLYANAPSRHALERLTVSPNSAAGADHAVKASRAALAAIPADAEVEHRFAGWDVAADGTVAAKVYTAPRPGSEHSSMAYLAERCGIDSRLVLGTLGDAGLGRALWSNDVVMSVVAGASGPLRLTVHVVPPRPAGVELARATLYRGGGDPQLLDVLLARIATTEMAWEVSGIAVGFTALTGVDRVNVYLAPTATAGSSC